MKTADVVIGANFGDEGKGLLTDYLSAQAGNAIVVRFNGGAQAGHTVETPDGKRHVFSHLGAGSFAEAETFLSRYFVCNPLLFRKEHAVFTALAPLPRLHVDDACAVTTPYDMMINQIAEESRGSNRHGSCGMGFGETIERAQHAALAITYGMLKNPAALRPVLEAIRTQWVPQRLAALGVAGIPQKWQERIAADGIRDKFIDDSAFFVDHSTSSPGLLAATAKRIVFEGAQGLMLDQARGVFPHVTRSHTGLRNVVPLAAEAGIDALNAVYLTRSYLTRHGAGPLAHELPALPGAEDRTNVRNEWQGGLRHAWLEINTLARFITDDLSEAAGKMRVTPTLAVTCLDQTGELVTYADGDSVTTGRAEGYLALLKKRTGAAAIIASHGPTRRTISAPRAAAA